MSGRFQRRHRMMLFAFAASALALALGGGQAPAAAAGLTAAALIYAALLAPPRQGRLVFLTAGLALVGAAVALQAVAEPVRAPALPAVAVAAFLVTVVAILHVGHFIRIPVTAIRLASAVTLLIAVMVLVGFAAYALDPAAVIAPVAGAAALAVCLGGLEWMRRRWINAPHRRRASLSVLLVCKNESDRIAGCLDRVAGWADEIVVLDSGSTDGTLDIVGRYTDRVWETDWAGYGRQKQRALERCTGDWVLNIDADEYLSEELKREIDAWLAGPTPMTGFRIAWISVIFGGPVHFGADGRYHKRLFRRAGAHFDGADVHEDVVLPGPVATLGGPVYHHTFRDYAHMKAKFTEYALISARRLHARGRRSSLAGAWLRGAGNFVLLYLRRLGILDGRRGLLMAVMYAVYTFDKYAAVWAMSRRQDD